MTPFTTLYGRDPSSIPDYIYGSMQLNALNSSLQQRQLILDQLKQNLQQSRQKMETKANKHRTSFTFNIGDLVILRLRPYGQQTVALRPSQKLSKYYHGPFIIVKRVGAVAYELDLPSTSKIHHVVHVSLLRPFFGNSAEKTNSNLPLNISNMFIKEKTNSYFELLPEAAATGVSSPSPKVPSVTVWDVGESSSPSVGGCEGEKFEFPISKYKEENDSSKQVQTLNESFEVPSTL